MVEQGVDSSTMPAMQTGYRIYPDGRVISLKTGWQLSTHVAKKSGYPSVGLKRDGRTVVYLIHRLVAMCFIPNPDGKPQVNHIDGDKLNNSIANLEWCTDAENKRHAYAIGIMPRSTVRQRASRTKLADNMIAARRRFSDVESAAIMEARKAGEPCRSIGRRYGCSHSIISRLCTGQSYARQIGGDR